MKTMRKILLVLALLGLLSGCSERRLMIREAKRNTPVEVVNGSR